MSPFTDGQEAERDSFGRRLPDAADPGRLLVGWPRPVSLLGFGLIAAIGVAALLVGGAAGFLVGAFFGLVGGGGMAAISYTRVWVDGTTLLLRMPFRGTRTMRIDRIVRASLSAFGRNQGPMLTLVDADGTSLTIDATNLRLTGLYIVLAQHIPVGGAGGDQRLERRLRKHRRDDLLG